MKVTRFVNGNKVEKPLDREIKVRNEIVQNAIEKVNRRILDNMNFESDFVEQNLYE